jgi:glycosyltransferase involved in cell wall biosynthesis
MSLDSPLVSIVVPSYNHAKYIKETILSIVHQTYQNIELIVIDDGSKDNSVEILKDLQKEFDFILILRENRGVIKTLNEGLALAKGKYFCGFASDDIMEINRIKLQVEIMELNTQYAITYGKMKVINQDGQFVKNLKSKYALSGNLFYKIFERNFITAPTVLFQKKVLEELEGFSTEFDIEDLPMWLKISQKYPIGFVDEFLVSYRIHGNNMSSNLLKMIQQTELILDSFNIDKKTQKSLNKSYYRWFCDLSKTDFLDETKKYMIKAMPSSFYKPRFMRSALRYFLKKRKSEK